MKTRKHSRWVRDIIVKRLKAELLYIINNISSFENLIGQTTEFIRQKCQSKLIGWARRTFPIEGFKRRMETLEKM